MSVVQTPYILAKKLRPAVFSRIKNREKEALDGFHSWDDLPVILKKNIPQETTVTERVVLIAVN